jgi:hypothetical protein
VTIAVCSNNGRSTNAAIDFAGEQKSGGVRATLDGAHDGFLADRAEAWNHREKTL